MNVEQRKLDLAYLYSLKSNGVNIRNSQADSSWRSRESADRTLLRFCELSLLYVGGGRVE